MNNSGLINNVSILTQTSNFNAREYPLFPNFNANVNRNASYHEHTNNYNRMGMSGFRNG